MTKRRDQALAYARAGIPIFPCRVNGKEPLPGSEGFKDATTDIPTIERWWAQADYNIGLVPESADSCVIDLDTKSDGPAHWETLLNNNGPAQTRVVNTPSGGQHWWFYGSLGPTASRLGPGIDTRGRNSYVLVPPSVINGVEYTEAGGDQSELPEWVQGAIKARERTKASTAVEDADLDHNVDRARGLLRYYVEHNDVAVENQGGNDRTYRLATELLNLGVSGETAAELMLEHWNPHCEPPWDPEELEAIVGNAEKYAQNEAGCWALSGTFLENPDVLAVVAEYAAKETQAKVERAGKWPVMRTVAEIRNTAFAKPQWVWENRLLAFEPNLVTGDAGVGKTTLAENLAVTVAAGVPMLNAPTKRMPVVLLVAEDTYGPVRDNILAIQQALQVSDFALERIHLLSVKSDRIDGGHRLASITDDGEVSDTAFMREYLAPKLAAIGACLFIIDPLMEFVRFNNLADEACRALATKFLATVSRIGIAPGQELGPITPVVLDHPSKASMASGAHYAGSTQMKAAFSFVATLKGGELQRGALRQQEMEYEILKGRYAGKDTIKFFRIGSSPAFAMDGPPGHTQVEIMQRVYEFVCQRIDAGLPVHKDERGDWPLSETAHALGLDPRQVQAAFSSCMNLGYLKWEKMAGGGGRDRRPAHFERGPMQTF